MSLAIIAAAMLAAQPVAAAHAEPANGRASAMPADLAADPQWRRLVHYVADTKSDVLPGDFFLAPNGQNDPSAELSHTIRALTAPPTGGLRGSDPDTHAQCRFPARYAFLAAHVPAVAAAAPAPCPAYAAWREDLSAQGATVIFASGHLSNPASFYGHIMLRIDRDEAARDGAGTLMDATLNYGAIYPENENGLAYIVRGLTGAYPSGFSQLGFYNHLQRYTEVEQRDVWEYELALSADEVDRLAAHAWELRDTNNRYYFAKQNCAWRIAELIGVAVERDMNQSVKPWAMPVDVLAELQGRFGGAPLVANVSYVPSREARTASGIGALPPDAANAARRLADTDADPDGILGALEPALRAPALDLAIDRVTADAGEDDVALAARKRRLLLARLSLAPGTDDAEAAIPDARPDEGQRSSLFRLAARHNTERGTGIGMRARIAYYDLLTVSPATAPGSELTLIDVEAEVLDGEADLRRVELVRITALGVNRTGFASDDKAAWRVRAGAEAARLECRGCLQGYVEGGYGKAVALGPNAVLFGFANARAAWPDRDQGHARLGGSGGLLLGEDRPLRALIEAGGWQDIGAPGDTGWFTEAEVRFGASDTGDVGLSVRVEDEVGERTLQAEANWSLYF